ncbi:MAG: DUF3427 domain-containing protein, partial [Phycisphaerales bacterium]|nr:DUF3427 domain-containing protein [Phycisphaerales bacterium]
NLRRPQMAIEIGVLSSHLKRPPKISEVTSYLDISIDDVLKRGMWSKLLKDAGNTISLEGDDLDQLGKGIRRLAHIDAPDQISFLLNHLNSASPIDRLSEEDKRRLRMLHITLWLKDGRKMTLEEADRRLRSNPTAVSDLVEVLTHQRDHTYTRPQPALAQSLGPLTLHAQYTRDEILAALGYWRMDHRPDCREGVLHIEENQLDIFFITLNKSEDAYSPTTMYDDYVISDELFHWQTQSRTSTKSPTGKRYINHKELGYTPLLFVRDVKELPGGLALPYVYLGPAHYVSHEGSQPINMVWQLETAMPARLYTRMSRELSA